MTVRWNRQVVDRARQGAEQGLLRSVELVRSEVIRLILRTSKSGRTYRRRGVLHKASAPGEAPASDTGHLVRSITTEVKYPVGTITARTAYAEHLEYGTGRMQARPFMRPALANTRAQINDIMHGAVRTSVQ